MIDGVSLLIGLAIGAIAAAVVGLLTWRLGKYSSSSLFVGLQQEATTLRTQLGERDRAWETQRKQIEADEARLGAEFENLSNRVLDENTRKFLQLASQTLLPVGDQLKVQLEGQLGTHRESIAGVVKPLETALKETQELVHRIENTRKEDYGGLDAQLKLLMTSTDSLRKEAGAISGALRNSQAKGSWGEVALRNLVELAGMTEHSDFETQVSLGGVDERVRPDMIVKLPSGRVIPVDSKMSSAAYLRALEAQDDETREQALADHAGQVLARVRELSGKEYWEKLSGLGQAPEFVVMFIPGDNLFAAALSKDPTLFERAVRGNVMLAGPTVLLPLLRVVEIGWRQSKLLDNVEEIREQARELHDRLVTMTRHIQNVGTKLGGAVTAYNAFIGSYETRVLVQAREFKDLGVEGVKTLPERVESLGTIVRRVSPPALPLEPSKDEDDPA